MSCGGFGGLWILINPFKSININKSFLLKHVFLPTEVWVLRYFQGFYPEICWFSRVLRVF